MTEAARILESSYRIRVAVDEDTGPDSALRRESAWRRTKELFKPDYRVRTALASIISGTQSAQYFAVGFYIPTIAAVLFGDDLTDTILATLIINLFGIVGGVLQSLVTARLGMRLLAGIGYSLIIVCTLGLAIGSNSISVWISTGLVALFVFGQSFGPGPQGKTMAALSYPTRLRGTGTGWAESMSRVGSILGFYIFPLLLASLGLAGTMGWLTLIPAVGLVAVVMIKWNPLGAEVEDEQQEMVTR
jgi:predicted MFS family arabinose efflux permease